MCFLSGSRGFTLVELLTVLALLGILTAIAIPRWNALLPTFALNGAARQIQSELHRIKSQAIAENTAIRLVFSTTAHSYTVERMAATIAPLGTKSLPQGVKVLNPMTLGFTPRGTPTPGTGGTIKLCNLKGVGTNLVVSSTGRVRICKPSGCNGTC